MRNLKRALSLAMASVMLLGLMVVGTGASYSDVSAEDNVEAIEVLQAVGIMVGDDNGDFNPDQNVTRNEMAVVMANLMDYRVASYSGTSPFTDVPDWAEPYVAACYTNGITAGTSATTFGGDQTVTTAQAALMLMKALGYFQYQSDFGDDWQLSTVSQGNKIDLFVDVDSGVREATTRNDVAQLVLNTLKSGMVEADDDTIKVETGDVSVEAGRINYSYVTSGQSYARAISDVEAVSTTTISTSGYIVELGEKLYQGSLKLDDSATNGFGAPANQWTYNSAEVGTYATSADYTFEGAVESQAMYDAVSRTVVNNYTWTVYVDGDDGSVTSSAFLGEVKDNNSDDLTDTGRGTTTYVYLDDDADDPTVTVCIVNTYAAEITEVDDGTIVLDDDSLEFDIEGYDEEDVVLYTKSYDGSDWTVESILGLAELVEGEATTVRFEDRVVVDGTTYRYSTTFGQNGDEYIATASVGENVAFYLDAQGNIIRIGDATESNDYAYVYSIGSANSLYGDEADYGAKLVFTDGTTANVSLDSDCTDSYDNVEQVRGAYAGRLVSYSEEDDGTYDISVVGTDGVTYGADAADDVIKNGAARVNIPGDTIYVDKNTAFLIFEDADDDEVSAYVGYDNVPNVDANSSTEILYYTNNNGVVKAVVVIGCEVSGSANDVIFVVGNDNMADGKIEKTGSTEYYVFDAVINGEVTSISVKRNEAAADTLATLSDGEIGVFFGYTENSSGFVTKLTASTPSDVEVNGVADSDGSQKGEFTAWTGTRRVSSGGNLTFNTKYDSISMAANDDAVIVYYDGDDLTIASSVKTDADDEAYVVTDDGVIIGIFVNEQEG